MIIECPSCESKVDAKILAVHESLDPELGPYKISFLECPVCNDAMLGYQDYIPTGPDDYDWGDPVRVWPEPEKYLSGYLPDIVRSSLDEAKKCYKAEAYSACAVMCGRVLEGICSEHATKNKFLKGGLKDLLDMQIIDKRIYEWGEALRTHRNIGAHATKEKISKEDAKFLLDFAIAISEYIYVLTEKFKEFMEKKEKRSKRKED